MPPRQPIIHHPRIQDQKGMVPLPSAMVITTLTTLIRRQNPRRNVNSSTETEKRKRRVKMKILPATTRKMTLMRIRARMKRYIASVTDQLHMDG